MKLLQKRITIKLYLFWGEIMKGKIDLHMHSAYSIDGEFEPKVLIEKAKAAGIEVVALSDHNSIAGVDEMVAYGKEAGIRVIPAIEFDTKFEGFDTHILGYNLDYHHPCFDGYDKKIDAKIHDSFRGVMQRIKDHFGAVVEIDEIIEDISKGGNPFDKMYGRILHDPRNAHIEAFKPYQPGGHRCEPAVVNFYWDLLSAGTPCYVPVDYPKMEDIVKLIHEHGGKAVIAHPWKKYYHREDLLDKAISLGIDGIEAYSNYHEKEHNDYYYNYCIEHHVPITCGSDFHGKFKKAIELGEYGCEKDAMLLCEAFLQLLDK